MNIKQLIEVLSHLPEDSEVFMASDEEGNSYSVIDPDFGCCPYYINADNIEPVEPDDMLEGDEDLPIGVFIYPGYF